MPIPSHISCRRFLICLVCVSAGCSITDKNAQETALPAPTAAQPAPVVQQSAPTAVQTAQRAQIDCSVHDWQRLGYEHGLAGKRAEIGSDIDRYCREIGFEPDRLAYVTGRFAGLRQYCTPNSGYLLAIDGRAPSPDASPCPPSLQPGFESGIAAAYKTSPL